jgi:thiosulfate/3-mercaptopyruvate sulfurtransferase
MIPPVVGAAWLQARRDDVVVADVRWYLDGRSGRDAYAGGHLPGAVFVDLDAVLAGPATTEGGRHPLPDPEAFARGMAELGIGDGDTVVAYDDDGGVMAARLVWMLRATGHDAALLDGGIAAWDEPLETETPPRPPATFVPVPWPADRIATADDAADRANVVIDARTRERYLGLDDPVDPRWGHVPGARSLPSRENLVPDGRFLAADDLRARFEAIGVRPGTPVVSYCGSGVTACHNLLAMERAGVGDGRLFPGSWSQWSADERRPVATGDD